MAKDQKADHFETPPYEEIPGITRNHLAALESTDDPDAWLMAKMKSLILRTVGRKSGKTHKVVLPYWQDAAGNRILAASYGGGPVNPAWFHNLADRKANPKVWIKERAFEAFVRADVLEGAEHDEIWQALTADRPWYTDYLAKTGRTRIPLIRLVED
ncbi:MAG: nitroreductase/quinone reductase family protein [Deltaproteobacteria bacterium]